MRSNVFIAALLALAALAAPRTARAVPVDFSAGSWVIPMDACYQPTAPYTCTSAGGGATCSAGTRITSNFYAGGTCPEPLGSTPARDGVVKAYGLVYRLIEKNVPLYYIVQTDTTIKGAINAVDMTVTKAGGDPVKLLNHDASSGSFGTSTSFMTAGHPSIDYRGAPFVISAADVPTVKTLLQTDPLFTGNDPRTGRHWFQDVYIHETQTNILQASVKALLATSPPKIALMNIGNAAIGNLEGYLRDAGLYTPTAVGIYPTIGDVFTEFDNVSDFTSGGLISGNFGVLWMPHWQGSALSNTDLTNTLTAIKNFNNAGHAVLAQCASVGTIEGSDYPDPAVSAGHFMTNATSTNVALTVDNVPQPLWPRPVAGEGVTVNPTASAPVWSNPLVQIGDYPLTFNVASHVFDFVPFNGYSYKTYTTRLVATAAPAAEAAYNNQDLEVVHDDPNQPDGPLIYIGGHAFGTQGSSCDSSGCATFPQTSMIGPERLILNSLIFLGQIPQSQELTRSAPIVYKSDTGIDAVLNGRTYLGSYVQQTLPAAAYPPWKGHFREYVAGALSGANVTAFGSLSLLSNWDAATHVATQATADTRTIFTGKFVGGHWTQVDFSPVNAGTLGIAAATITQIRKGGLGGIDHSIPAIIGPGTITGQGTRPTVAYFGALDGMLHAILVSDPNNLTGKSPGDELWAFIPPSQLAKVVAQTAGVDGSPVVGDAFVDTGNGLRQWRTILAIPDGNYAGGTIDALDVTDPVHPTAAGAPAFLWEASDSVTVSGKTYVMGRAQGGAIASTNSTSGGVRYGVFFATDNTNGTGGNGFNMYALDAGTGAVIWRLNQTYANDTNHNDVPGMVAVVDSKGDGGAVDTAYFADIEGKVWGVPTINGQSPKLVYDAAVAHGQTNSINYPIESGIALYRDTANNHLSLAGITGGADWVPLATRSYVFSVDVQPSTPTYKDLYTLAAGERVYASPTVAGNQVYFLSSNGALQSGIGANFQATGSLYSIDLFGTNLSHTLAAVKQGASQVAVDANGNVVAASAAGITQNSNAPRDTSHVVVQLQNATAKPLKTRAWLDLH